MKKRLISILLVVCMLCTLLPVSAFAAAADTTVVANGTCGADLTWTLDSDGVLAISGTGDMTDYEPNEDTPWESYSSSVKSIVINDGVTSIGDNAFSYCGNLTSVTMAGSVTRIGTSAFFCSSGLTSITIGSGVKRIDDYAFGYCRNLTSINVPEDNEKFSSIDGVLFDKEGTLLVCCPGGKSGAYIIPDCAESIYTRAFYDCEKLTSITIGSGLMGMFEYPFDGCTGLTSINAPADNEVFTSIDGVLFSKDKKELVCFPTGRSGSYNVPDFVESIADYAFYDCDALTNVVIPDSVESIGYYAFESCDYLASVTIGSGVTEIMRCAFESCVSLSHIYFKGNMPDVGGEAFDDVTALAFYPAGNTSYANPDPGAFVGSNLTWLEDSDSDEALYSGTCGDNITWTISRSGTLMLTGSGSMPNYNSNGNAPWYDVRFAITEVEISDGISSIGAYAFEKCRNITSITIPDSVTSIGSGAFVSCKGLRSVELPDSITTIEELAFMWCDNLTSVKFAGNAPTTFASNAFMDINASFKIIAPNNATWKGKAYNDEAGTWNKYPIEFYSVGPEIIADGKCGDNLTWTLDENGLLTLSGTGNMPNNLLLGNWYSIRESIKKVLIEDGVTSIGYWAFYFCSNLESVTIPDSVTSIGDYAFEDCRSLTKVTIPYGVTSIGKSSFEGCSSLESVTIPDSVTSVGFKAFFGCSSLESVAIPDSVTSIGIAAFSECESLVEINVDNSNECYVSEDGVLYNKSKTTLISCPAGKNGDFYIPDGITNIGSNAFEGCHRLTSVSIPNDVTNIGERAFAYCYDLTNVIIPDSVMSIEGYAFDCCTGLTSVTIPDSVTSIGDGAFAYCNYLDSIRFEGNAPTTFGKNVLNYYSEDFTIYAPADNTTWTGEAYDADAGTWNGYPIEFYSVGPEIIADGECGENLTWTLDSNGLLTISGTGAMEDYGYSGASWFSNRNDIYSVVISNEVTSIGRGAFNGCENITSITIPNSVTSIGDAAFYSCSSLASISIGDGVTSIGRDAFYDCSSLTSVTIPDGVTSIGGFAFAYCSSLESVTIPDSVTGISEYMFIGCSSLESITIPDSVTSIGFCAFAECGNLENIIIPDSVTSIGPAAFFGCVKFADENGFVIVREVLYNYLGTDTDVTVPDGVTSIDYGVFAGYSNLKNITIPDSVTSIGAEAFASCINLTSLTIPDSVTSIGNMAFAYCSNLESAKFDGNAPAEFGDEVFFNCYENLMILAPKGDTTWTDSEAYDAEAGTWNGWAIEFYSVGPEIIANGECGENLTWTLDSDGLLTISGTGAMYVYDDYENAAPWSNNAGNIISVVIENGVTSISDYAFCYCDGLTGITIPEGVTSIGYAAFFACTSLESVDIPDGVIRIGDAAFYSCSNLASITIPDSVTSIGYAAFVECASLTSVTIPNSVTSIGDEAFEGCTGLTSVTIRDGVESIGFASFALCNNLASITIPDSVTSIAPGAFFGCEKLADENGFVIFRDVLYYYVGNGTDVTVPDGVTCLSYGAISENSFIENVTIPDSVESIGDMAVAYCSSLESVTFEGNAPDEFGSDVFVDCAEGTKILAPKGDTTWTDSEAYDADAGTWNGWAIEFYSVGPEIIADGECGENLTWTLDSEGLLTISGTGAMYEPDDHANTAPWLDYKENIVSVVVENGVTSISSYAFECCTSLTGMDIPDSVTRIGNYAFFGCSGLKSVTIGNGVTNIGNSAFYGCTDLENLTFGNSVQNIGDNAFAGCINLSSITIPDSVMSIGDSAFYACEKLADENGFVIVKGTLYDYYGTDTDVTVPDSVTCISRAAFSECSSLESVIIPDSVRSIGFGAFGSCVNLESATFKGNAPEEFGDYVFVSCAEGFKILAPKGDTTWTDSEVYNAETGIWYWYPLEFYVPVVASGYCGGEGDGTNATWQLDSEGTLTISGNGAMKDYLLPRNVNFTTYALAGYYDYSDQIKRIVVNEGITTLGDTAFYGCDKVESVSLPDSLTDISRSAFYYCTSLKKISIPAAVTSVGYDAFTYCQSLETVEVEEGNANYYTEDGVLYAIDRNAICLYPAAKPGAVYTVKDGTVLVRPCTFHSNQNLQCVILPESVTGIDLYAFSNSQNIKSVYLPKSLTTINIEGFYNCRALTDVYYGGSEEEWSEVDVNLFNYSLEEANMHYSHNHSYDYEETVKPSCTEQGTATGSCECGACSVKSVDALDHNYQYGVCERCGATSDDVLKAGTCGENLKWTLFKDGLLTIYGTGDMEEYGYLFAAPGYRFSTLAPWGSNLRNSITAVVIEQGVTSITAHAFMDCENIESVSLPDTLTAIPGDAFRYCDSLTRIDIPDSVVTIGALAFYESGLKEAVIPNSVTEIKSGAFEYCDELTEVTIPASVMTVEDNNFKYCTGLTTAKFEGNAPTAFGKDVFASCAEDFKILAPKGDTTWTDSRAYDAEADTWNGYPIEFYKVIVASGECGENLTWTLDSEGKLTISGTGPMTDYGTNNYSDTSATSAPWGQYYADIKSVEIGNGVTSIGNYAFYRCSGLTGDLIIPDGVTSIGGSAFYVCSGLTGDLIIPDSVTSIGGSAFDGCSGFTGNLIIPDSVTSIGSYAFRMCEGFTGELIIPDSVTEIGQNAFRHCRGFTGNLIIPDSVTKIGNEAFSSCSGFTGTMVISGNLSRIDFGAFENCTGLTGAKFEGNAPTRFEKSAFTHVVADFTIYAPANNTTWRGAAYNAEAGTWYGYPIEFYSVGPDIIASGECGENLTWTLDSNGLLTISGTGDMYNYDVGDGLTMAPWSRYYEEIKAVEIEDGVTSVGDGAFAGCNGLTSATIPDSVTAIGGWAFYGCNSLENITIPDSVTSIGNHAFAYTPWIEAQGDFVIVNGILLKYQGTDENVVIPDNVTIVGNCALSWNSSLKSVSIPDGVTSIGESAFEGCANLESVAIPDSVTCIGRSAFFGCENLADENGFVIVKGTLYDYVGTADVVTIPDSVTSISDYALSSGSFTGVTIPDSVNSISEGAFCFCSNLTSATFEGNAPETFGTHVFESCANDFRIIAPEDDSTWTDGEAYDAEAGTWNGWAIEFYHAVHSYTAVVTAPTCTEKGYTTYTCSACGDSYVADEVDALGHDFVDHECTRCDANDYVATGTCGDNLTWTLDSDGFLTISGEGAMKNYTSSAAPWYSNRSLIKSAVIGDGVTSIGSSAFYNCSSLTSVTIGNGVTSIECDAFCDCSSLTSVTIPNSVKSIGETAFCDCTALTSVTIGNGVTSIDTDSFVGCSSLISINVDGNNKYYSSENGVLFNKDKTEIVCYPGGKIGQYIIPNSVKSIGSYAFYGCSGLTSMTIPSSVTSIGSRAFHGCSSLTSVTIPDSVTSIGVGAFYGCSSLTSVTISKGVTSIGSVAFSGCSSLESAKFEGNAPTTFGSSVFYNCADGFKILAPANNTWKGSAYDASAGTWNGYPIEFYLPYDQVFARSEVELNGAKYPNGNRDSETNLGDLVTDSMLWTILKDEGSVTVPTENVVAITNGGGIRAWIHEGDITKQDINTVLPFGNTVAVAYVTGAELLEALEASTYCNPTALGAFPQVAGIDFTIATYKDYNANAETYPASTYYGPASINRVTINSINGNAFDPEATYAVVTNNFCAAGGDTYYAFASASAMFDTGIPLDEALIAYITEELGSVVGEQYAEPQGRISIVNEPETDIIASGECGDNLTWTLDENGLLTIDGEGEMYDMTDDLVVVSWNTHVEETKSVVINDGVTSIGGSSFMMWGITDIQIPDSVTSIGNNAFLSCTNLTEIDIPDSVTSIGNCAFWNCTGLTDVVIPDSVTEIGEAAFGYCDNLKSVNIPDGMTSSLYQTFWFCSALESITIPDSVTNIDRAAFNGCSSLERITIPESVTNIGYYAFNGCYNLLSATFEGNAPETFSEYVFDNCAPDFTIYAPAGNSTWTSSDAYDAAAHTWNGYPIRFYSDGGEIIDFGTCGDNLMWTLYSDGTLTIDGRGAMTNYSSNNSSYAPWYDSRFNITSVEFGSGVTAIDAEAFENFSNLQSIEVDEGNAAYHSSGNCLIETATKTLILGCSASVIPSDGSITSIDRKAFYGCSGLESLTIPEGVTSIGDGAFYGCYMLRSVTLPASLKTVGDGAFGDCYNINGVYISDLAAWCGIKFLDSQDGTWYTYGYGSNPLVYANNLYINGERVTELVIPDGVKRIEKNVFKGCYQLTSVTIPNSVIRIGQNAFSDCIGLENAVFEGKAPTAVGSNAFYNCANGFKILAPEGESSWKGVAYKAAEGTWNGYPIEFYNGEHIYIPVVTKPTCTEQGYTTYTCSICGDSYVDNYVPALGHHFVDGVCTVCGAVDPDYDPPVQDNPFVDVSNNAWYRDSVLWAHEKGITKGVDETHFAPDAICSRGQVMTFLWRAEGCPEPVSTRNPFVDVVNSGECAYYYKAILWAYEKGITNGVDATHFAPFANVSRGEFVTFLWRYAGAPGISAYNPFTDVSNSGVCAYYYNGILWANANGITNGVGQNLFAPNLTVTRGQVVTFLHRYATANVG